MPKLTLDEVLVVIQVLAEKLLRDVIWAKELNIPVMIYGAGAGPLNAAKQLVADTLNQVDVITVRENESKRILNDVGVTKEIIVTADPALLLRSKRFTKEMIRNIGIDLEKPLVGFAVREPGGAAPNLNIDHYHGVLGNSADYIIERFNAQVIFIPMEQGANRDAQHAHAIISKMLNAHRASVLNGEYTSGQLLGLTKHMAFAVGMRLHFLIFAGLQSVPFIPLPYASKVKGYLEDLDMPYLPMEEWNAGKICAMIDRAWDNRKLIKKKLKQHIPSLQEKAKQTNIILCDYLKKIKPKK